MKVVVYLVRLFYASFRLFHPRKKYKITDEDHSEDVKDIYYPYKSKTSEQT